MEEIFILDFSLKEFKMSLTQDKIYGRSFKIKRPTPLERLYNAKVAIFVDHKDGVMIDKNCWGPHGKVNTSELIEILCRILVEHVFDGRMKLFQEGMRKRLKYVIKRIVKKG